MAFNLSCTQIGDNPSTLPQPLKFLHQKALHFPILKQFVHHAIRLLPLLLNLHQVTNVQNPATLAAMLEIKQGNYNKALELFARADTKSPLNLYYMAVAYDKKGEKDKASELFENLNNWNENSLGYALVRKRVLEMIKQ